MSTELGRTIVLIDGYATISASKANEFVIDWKRLIDHYEDCSQLLSCHFYSTYEVDDEGHNFRQPLFDWMLLNGYDVTSKKTNEPNDYSFGCEITVDAMKMTDKIDTLVLYSNNDCFVPLIKELRDNGVTVLVCSDPNASSKRLRASVRHFINIDDMAEFIEKRL